VSLDRTEVRRDSKDESWSKRPFIMDFISRISLVSEDGEGGCVDTGSGLTKDSFSE
jgi:hypothetical protein